MKAKFFCQGALAAIGKETVSGISLYPFIAQGPLYTGKTRGELHTMSINWKDLLLDFQDVFLEDGRTPEQLAAR